MTSLIVERVQDRNALEPIRDTWNSLLDKSETKTVELTYEWQMTYWQRFSGNAELFVLTIREASEIVAIAPLKRTLASVLGIKIHCLELIAAPESNYQDLVIGKNTNDVLECIASYLASIQSAWDILNLRHIPHASNTVRFFLERFTSYPFRKIAETEKCAFLQIETSWEKHKKSLGKDRRHRMNNRVKRMERDIGRIQLRTCINQHQFQSDIEEFFVLHRKRWNQTETPSQFMDSRYCEFYSSVGAQLLSKGQLGLSVLAAGETTLAQLLFFTFDKTSLIQLIAYDPAHYPYSPMLVLQELFVEKSLANGIEVVDWGTYYPWKELWANRTKNRVNLKIYPKRILPDILFIFSGLYEALRASMQQDSFVMNSAKFLRRKVRWLNRYSQQDAE